MASEAFRLCDDQFDGIVQAKHMGGTYVNSDLGRPLIFRNEANHWEWKLSDGSWGEPEWHDYARQPNGLYEGDAVYSDGFSIGNREAIIDGSQASFWEETSVVTPRAQEEWDNEYLEYLLEEEEEYSQTMEVEDKPYSKYYNFQEKYNPSIFSFFSFSEEDEDDSVHPDDFQDHPKKKKPKVKSKKHSSWRNHGRKPFCKFGSKKSLREMALAE